MGRKKTLGLSGGPAKQKYKCKVCDVHPRGCDLQRHYKLNTNWERMEELQACIGDEALSRRKGDTDKHTLFMFENNYNMEKMPTYQTHALWRDQDDVENDDQEDGGNNCGILVQNVIILLSTNLNILPASAYVLYR